MDDETMFLCGYKRTIRYGTTTPTSSGPSKPSYNKIIKHRVVPSDTLQGIALKYGSQITEIKRMNKLWSNDSIHLREILNIPVLVNEDSSTSSTPAVVGQQTVASSTVHNGPVPNTDSCYSSMSEGDQDSSSFAASQPQQVQGVSPRNVQLEDGGPPSTSSYDKSELTVSDFLERIDSNIKITSRNVKKLEKQNTIEKLLNKSESNLITPSNSRQSFQDVSLTRTPSPIETRVGGAASRVVGNSNKSSSSSKTKQQSFQLQQIHDQFYQL